MPLWDTNDTIIYLKSTNPMGMPNPLQKIYYRMEETQQTSGAAFRSAAPALMSGEAEAKTEVAYVTRDDLERMKEELRESITEAMTSAQTAQKPIIQTRTEAEVRPEIALSFKGFPSRF